MKKIIGKLFIAYIVFALLLMIMGCASNKIELITDVENLSVGEQIQLEISKNNEIQQPTEFYYGSSDPEIAQVTDGGILTFSQNGEVTIYVQAKNDAKQKINFEAKASYNIVDELAIEYDSADKIVRSYDSLPFWERNGYVAVDEHLSVRGLIDLFLSRAESDYIFTQLYQDSKVKNDDLIVVSEWGNKTVEFNDNLFKQIDLNGFIHQKFQINPNDIGQVGIDTATETIKTSIKKSIVAYQGKIDLSDLPNDYEYRVSVKVGYTLYRAESNYNRGPLKGGITAITNLLKLDFDSVLTSCSYEINVYEIILDDCTLVIEQRKKQP